MSIVRTGWLGDTKPAIGVVHLRPLPGSPRNQETLDEIADAALRDAEAIVEGGMDGLLIENFGDTPFYSDAYRRDHFLHDGNRWADSAAILRAAWHQCATQRWVLGAGDCLGRGAQFIRVNILSGARVTDQGIIEGIANHCCAIAVCCRPMMCRSGLMWRSSIRAAGPRSLQDEVTDTIERRPCGCDHRDWFGTGRPASLQK